MILYFGYAMMRTNHSVPKLGLSAQDGQEYEMVGDDKLPDYPTPVVISDKRGRAKWTVSIPPDYNSPLEPKEYADICSQTGEVSNHVIDLHKHGHSDAAAHFTYYHVDSNFMDVEEAEKVGMLPGSSGQTRNRLWDSVLNGKHGAVNTELIQGPVCQKTLTFLLETSDAGLGSTLMALWMAYGLAKKEGRDFFIDDSRWAYGKYSSYFQPPPLPSCRPPPSHQMLPCPHHARHLVVSHATTAWTFGAQFNEAFENGHKMGVTRQKPIYELAHTGFQNLFHLRDDDSGYVDNRINSLLNQTIVPPEPNSSPSHRTGLIVGVHVRHGDKHPLDFMYRESYIPLGNYVDAAREILDRSFSDDMKDMMPKMKSILVVASDDPDVYESEEFSHAQKAQEMISLGSQKNIESHAAGEKKSAEKEGLFRRFAEESVGWEGGFFSGMFWSLGHSTSSAGAMNAAASGAYGSEEAASILSQKPSEETLQLRQFVGRAYLMDLAVLGKSDAVVCTISAMGCKLLAVMMGWKRAFEVDGVGNWRNVDGEFEWRGVAW